MKKTFIICFCLLLGFNSLTSLAQDENQKKQARKEQREQRKLEQELRRQEAQAQKEERKAQKLQQQEAKKQAEEQRKADQAAQKAEREAQKQQQQETKQQERDQRKAEQAKQKQAQREMREQEKNQQKANQKSGNEQRINRQGSSINWQKEAEKQIAKSANYSKNNNIANDNDIEVQKSDIPKNQTSESSNINDDGVVRLFIIIIVIIVVFNIIRWYFSGRCSNCGKLRAMKVIDEQYLGRAKAEHKKDTNGNYYTIYYNNIEVTRRCKYCGHEDCKRKVEKSQS